MVKEPPLLCSEPVNSPGRAVEVLYDLLHDMDRELLIVVNLKTDMTPINMNIASIGTVNASLSSPRELLKSAVLSNAAATMIFHNHPSGNVFPSKEDIRFTKTLKEIGDTFGVPIIDHIIVGDNGYYSFYEEREEFLC